MSDVRKAMDPFLGKEVELKDQLVDRLRGRYAIGPRGEDGEPDGASTSRRRSSTRRRNMSTR